MAFLLVLIFWFAISGALSFTHYVVVGPLVHGRERECVANANFVIFLGGGALRNVTSGRATSLKKRTFDSTMGFPGEDVVQQPLW